MPPPTDANTTSYLLGRVALALAVVAAALAVERTLLADELEPLRPGEAKVKEVGISSELLDRELEAKVIVPEGAQRGRRSLVVFLHERGGNRESHISQELLDAIDRAGVRTPILAFLAGGEESFWHDREDGAWGSYVLDEAIPRLRKRLEIKPGRVLLAGISMGGYGAINLARQAPQRLCGAAAHAPTIWTSFEAAAEGAFDDPADFARNDVIEKVGSMRDERVWLDAGRDDPFREADRQLLAALDRAGARTSRRLDWPGGHETDYWRSHWSAYLRFYARALTACAEEDRESRRIGRSGSNG